MRVVLTIRMEHLTRKLHFGGTERVVGWEDDFGGKDASLKTGAFGTTGQMKTLDKGFG